MNSALYYPFTGPEHQSFLKTALFLWDSVDFIVPFTEFHRYGKSEVELEALEIVGREYVPTEKDKRAVHDELEDLCTSGIGDRFLFELERPDLAYDFYPQKLLDETWEMLEQTDLARLIQRDGRVERASTGPLFGYYMMTLLAICCSQNRKRLVTDQNDPYRALANLLSDNDIGSKQEDWHGRLIALSFAGPDFSEIGLESLVRLRSKEDQLMYEMRQNFLGAVDEAAVNISDHADNPNIVRDCISDFTSRMERDLRELKRALRRSATSLLLSKEFGFSVITAATAVTVAPAAGLLTAGGLTKGLMDYRDRRRKLLKEHPSSWLISAQSGNLPVF